MIISDLDFYLVAVPRDGSPERLKSLLVRLATDSGLEGWGEADVAWRPSELIARRNALLPILAGHSIWDIEELVRFDALKPPPLRSALEMACWDLIGRATGETLCHLFGGVYRKRIPLAVRLASEPADLIPQRARELAEQGFHTQIVTATGNPQADRATLAAVREAAGERVELRLDGRCRFDPAAARELCAELETESLRFFLDPLAGASFEQIASLRRQTSVPLAVGAAIRGPQDVLSIARSGVAPAIVVNFDQVGGLAAARKCATVAEAASISASLGGRATLGLAVAAMLQVAAATPSFDSANECAYHDLRGDVLAERLEIIDGMIAVPEGPGLGVEVDRAKIERYQLS